MSRAAATRRLAGALGLATLLPACDGLPTLYGDREPPRLRLTSPVEDVPDLSDPTWVHITGFATDDQEIERVVLRWNGEESRVDLIQTGATASFSVPRYLGPGRHAVELFAIDRAGNRSETVGFETRVYGAGPAIRVETPPGRPWLGSNRGAIRLVGTVTDTEVVQSLRYSFAGHEGTIPITPGTTVTLDHEIALPDGVGVLTLRATDGAGNWSEERFAAALERAAPGVVLVVPAVVAGPEQIVGSVRDAGGLGTVSFRVGGGPEQDAWVHLRNPPVLPGGAPAPGTEGSFVVDVPFEAGTTEFRTLVSDAAGNRTALAARVRRHAPAVQVAAGDGFSCAVFQDESLWCWGANDMGQLGRGLLGATGEPGPIASGARFSAVATGWRHACALAVDGTPYCWGALGTGGAAVATPVAVPGARLASVTAGRDHTCGVDASGRAFCWGDDASGLLGVGPGAHPLEARPVLTGVRFRRLTAGVGFTCGIALSPAFAHCWGSNGTGQLGTGSLEPAPFPVPVASDREYRSLDANAGRVCGISSDWVAYCWGRALVEGQAPDLIFRALHDGISYDSILAGAAHRCGTAWGGALFCAGRATGLFGSIHLAGDAAGPVRVLGELTFRGPSIRTDHTCGLTPRGSVVCWGANDRGQLGHDVPTVAP